MDKDQRKTVLEALAMAYFTVAEDAPAMGKRGNGTAPVAFDDATLESLSKQGLIRYKKGSKTVEFTDDVRVLGEMFAGGIALMADQLGDLDIMEEEKGARGGEVLYFPGCSPAAKPTTATCHARPSILTTATGAPRPRFDPAKFRPETEERGFLFRVELKLEGGQTCWRELIMPANCSFLDLHLAIQIAFGWLDAHLFDFKMNARGQRIHIEEACFHDPSFEPLAGPDEAVVEADGIFLSDVFPKSRTATYTYDYGDEWIHKIKLVKTYPTCPVEDPTLAAGDGQAPPEDVGGPQGYLDFLEAIGNKKNPDHADMADWARMIGWEQAFDLEETKLELEDEFMAGRIEWDYRLGLRQ